MNPADRRRMNLWPQIKHKLTGLVADRLSVREQSLQTWRERILFAIFFSSVLLGLLPLYHSVAMAHANRMWGHLVFYVLFYLLACSLLFLRRVPFKVRAWAGVAVFFTLGLVALFTLGPAGSGRSWFFATSVLASLLLGLWPAVAVLAVIAASLFTVGGLMESGRLVWPLLNFYSAETWRTTTYTLLLISSMITVSLAVLINGLAKALEAERQASAQLQAIHRRLTEEIDVRKRTEADLNRYRDDLEIKVGERTAELAAANRSLREEVLRRKEAEKALLHLASGAAHNFNNVLMSVMGNAQSAQLFLESERQDLARAGDHLDNVVRSARVGSGVAQRLVRFVTGREAGLGQGSAIAVESMLRSAVSILEGTWPVFRRGGLSLGLTCDPGLNVWGLESELVEVVLNLVKNSVEAMEGRGVIHLAAYRQGDLICLEVADGGPGVDAALLPRLFQPFVTSKDETGLGLGLCTSRHIVLAHGGQISAENRPGGGASFKVLLPAHAQAPALQPPLAPPRIPPQRVLLVDDEYLVAMGISAALEAAGHRVLISHDLSHSLLALDEFRPQVVVCDLNLPDGTGWDLVRKLSADNGSGRETSIPVIVLSGLALGPQAGRPAGAPAPWAMLNKPVERRMLLDCIARAVAASGSQAPGRV